MKRSANVEVQREESIDSNFEIEERNKFKKNTGNRKI
jgi:hypothetical protein